jgi:hypothetical protein
MGHFGKINKLLFLYRKDLEMQFMAMSGRKAQHFTSFPKQYV